MLKGFEEVLPGAADRIIGMAEKQSTHRQGLEVIAVKGDSTRANMGVICGFLIGLAGLYFGFQLIREGHAISGTIFGGGSLVGLVSVFVYGTRVRKKEREKLEQKARKLQEQQ